MNNLREAQTCTFMSCNIPGITSSDMFHVVIVWHFKYNEIWMSCSLFYSYSLFGLNVCSLISIISVKDLRLSSC